jgi:hypothetical protein
MIYTDESYPLYSHFKINYANNNYMCTLTALIPDASYVAFHVVFHFLISSKIIQFFSRKALTNLAGTA